MIANYLIRSVLWGISPVSLHQISAVPTVFAVLLLVNAIAGMATLGQIVPCVSKDMSGNTLHL